MLTRIWIILSLVLFMTGFSSAQDKVVKAKISTTFGDIIVKLHNDTPIHRDNFIKHANKGWFDQTLFHRVMPYFMAQGGDPNSVGATATQALGADQCAKLSLIHI